MDAASLSIFTLILCLLGGGGNELLDFIPTDAYWQAKRVKVSPDAMLNELERPEPREVSALVKDLGAAEARVRDAAARKLRAAGESAIPPLTKASQSRHPETARRAQLLLEQVAADLRPRRARRLMAIRTLGELKARSALPVLQGLTESTELFVADYARAAVGAIEGKPAPRPRPAETVAAAIEADVWMLPEDCRAVGQLVPPPGGKRVTLADLLGHARPAGSQTKEEVVREAMAPLIQLADQLGNVRLDAVTVGMSGDAAAVNGYVIVLARGLYDSQSLRMVLHTDKVASSPVDGVEVFRPDGQTALVLADDRRLVLMAAAHERQLPLEHALAAVKAADGAAPAGGLKAAAGMAALIESVDRTQAFWAAAEMTPAFRELPVLAPFDTVTAVGRYDKDGLHLTATAAGTDPAKAKAAAAWLAAGAKGGAEFLDGIKTVSPIIPPAIDFLRSMKVSSDGGNASASATLKASVAGILSSPLLFEAEAEVVEEEQIVVPEAVPQ